MDTKKPLPTPQEYAKMADKARPGTKSYLNIPKAFLIGGLICVLGEALLKLYQYVGLDFRHASAAVSVSLIFLSALLTGLNIYDNIAKHAGAGTLVPITGFANSVVAPAMEFKTEGLVLGLAAKMFVIAGPVIVYGITASVVYGLIIHLFQLV